MTDDGPVGLIGAGWATVDLDRAAIELAPLLADGAAFEEAAGCASLGARCRIGRANGLAPAPTIVLLEPATEGRLAATLARHGESWCATWMLDQAPWATTVCDPRRGPLGEERLVAGDPASGPHRLLVRPITIRP